MSDRLFSQIKPVLKFPIQLKKTHQLFNPIIIMFIKKHVLIVIPAFFSDNININLKNSTQLTTPPPHLFICLLHASQLHSVTIFSFFFLLFSLNYKIFSEQESSISFIHPSKHFSSFPSFTHSLLLASSFLHFFFLIYKPHHYPSFLEFLLPFVC